MPQRVERSKLRPGASKPSSMYNAGIDQFESVSCQMAEGTTGMHDIKSQPRLATATAEMMWACALAAARVAGASAVHGVALWSQMLRLAPALPLWPMLPGSRMLLCPEDVSGKVTGPDPTPGPAEPSEPAFASYRSAGGHAAAQVVIPP